MKKIIIGIIILFYFNAVAEEAKPDTLYYVWIPSLVASANLSQIAFSNWTKGGENSIAWSAITDFGLDRRGELWTLRNQFKSSYGRTKLGGGDFRTNENEIYLENVLSYNIGWEIDPYVSNTIRTQLTAAYDYENGNKEKIADFFDPGYIIQSIGFTYDKMKVFKTRVGVAFQETFTNQYNNYADDPTTEEIESFKFETGMESVSTGEVEFAENMRLKSKLRLFTRFEHLDVWDVRWDNQIVAKVNSFFNVNFTYLLLFEKSQSPTAQMKQTLQMGFTYTIF